MKSKNKTGYNLVPSEEPTIHVEDPVKESPIYNDEDGENKEMREDKKKKKEKKGKKLNRHRKTFWVCFSNVQIGSRLLSDDESKKKTKEIDDDKEFKVKEKGFLFSNVEIQPEEREKVQELVEKMRKKSCFLVCFSNIQVGL